jgi:hypothetical protein
MMIAVLAIENLQMSANVQRRETGVVEGHFWQSSTESCVEFREHIEQRICDNRRISTNEIAAQISAMKCKTLASGPNEIKLF